MVYGVGIVPLIQAAQEKCADDPFAGLKIGLQARRGTNRAIDRAICVLEIGGPGSRPANGDKSTSVPTGKVKIGKIYVCRSSSSAKKPCRFTCKILLIGLIKVFIVTENALEDRLFTAKGDLAAQIGYYTAVFASLVLKTNAPLVEIIINVACSDKLNCKNVAEQEFCYGSFLFAVIVFVFIDQFKLVACKSVIFFSIITE
jgi:hypothetical protein